MTTTPPLDDARIDAMRAQIMTAVDADVRARGRRTRHVLTGLAAAAVIVVAGGVGVSLGSDSRSEVTTASDSAGSDLAYADAAPPEIESPQIAPEAAGDAKEQFAAPGDRQVVRTGSATVIVSDPRSEADLIIERVEAFGGRVDSRSESGSGDTASAYLTVRVPTSRLTQAIDQLSQSGEVASVTLRNDDVTSTVVDLDARIRALTISIDRLEKILAESDTSADVVAAENALTQRQSQLEELTSQRAAISQDVSMARLDIDLVQEAQIQDVDPGGFLGGLTRGWNALVGTLNGVVEGAGAVLPWAGLALLAYGAARLVRRARRRA